MSLKERVEQIFRELGGALQPASGHADHFDGYVVEEPGPNEVRIRSGYGVYVRWVNSDDPGRRSNPELTACAEALGNAGLRVDRVEDNQGGYLWVTEPGSS